jgi:hypothetical protein
LVAGACSKDSDPIVPVVPSAKVRFVHVAPGVAGNFGFTANGQFAAGSALAFAQSTCSTVTPGSTSFGFGVANAGGTALNGAAMATLANQTVADGGNYTVVGTGNSADHVVAVFMLDNNFAGSLASNQAAVRFVNVAQGRSTEPNNFAVFKGVFDAGGTLLVNNPAVGTPTQFEIVTSGNNTYSLLRNHEIPLAVPQKTFDLQAGRVYTIAIVANGSGGFDLMPLQPCP